MIDLEPQGYGTHSLRRTKVSLVYKKTGNLRACQLLLGHRKLESTVRYLGVEVDDALEMSGRSTSDLKPGSKAGPAIVRYGWEAAIKPRRSPLHPLPCATRWTPVKIATFNINGVNKRLDPLLLWLAQEEPDIVCVQELKAEQSQFPAAAVAEVGYSTAWVGERSWNGVAVLSRLGEPVVTRTALPGDPEDRQSRYLEAAVAGWVIGCLYAPNGNPQPGPKFDYKLAWLRRLAAHASTLSSLPAPVVLAGDYNVVPTDADIYATRSWKKDALLQPEPRALYSELLESGWTDALRAQRPGKPPWTFWSYFRDAWPRNAGLRIDHLLLNPAAKDRLIGVGVDDWVRDLPETSDHAPAWVEVN